MLTTLSVNLSSSFSPFCIFVLCFWIARVNCSLYHGRVGMEFPGIPPACSEADTGAELHSLLAAAFVTYIPPESKLPQPPS